MKFIRIALFVVLGFVVASGQTQRAARGPRSPQATLSVPSDHQAIVRAIYRDMYTRVPAPPMNHPSTATFIVTYNGFTPAAQAAFQRAVDIWSSILVSPVPIRVTANWTPLGPGILGSAGASSVYRDFPNAPQAGTWYAVALAEKLAGADLNATSAADINANFSSAISNWYYGTDGNPPSGQFDLVSIVLHELGHGLTFVGSMTVTSGQGSWGISTGFPFIYDRFTENGAGQSLINTTLFPNPSTALATQLQSNSVFFNGPHAVTGNGGTRPPLYAPASWIQGSSYSHLDESTYPAGNPNSLMTPEFGMAEAIHSPGPVALGMFQDMGWTVGGSVSVSVLNESFEGTTFPPAGWTRLDPDGGTGWDRQLNGTTPVPGWQGGVITAPPGGGSGVAFCTWTTGGSTANDQWLVTPQITNIVTNDSLKFSMRWWPNNFADTVEVRISTTTPTVANFTVVVANIGFAANGLDTGWIRYQYRLSDFVSAGANIYIAFREKVADNVNDGASISLDLVEVDIISAVSDNSSREPHEFKLDQNYPNPFNPATTIGYRLASASHVTLRVYDVLGREVATLVNENRPSGFNEAKWNAVGVASGVYFCRMEAQALTGSATFQDTRKLTVLK